MGDFSETFCDGIARSTFGRVRFSLSITSRRAVISFNLRELGVDESVLSASMAASNLAAAETG